MTIREDKTLDEMREEFEREAKEVYSAVVDFLNEMPQGFAAKGHAISVLDDQLRAMAQEHINNLSDEDKAAIARKLEEEENKPPHLTLVH